MIITGDARDPRSYDDIEPQSVDCVVTSPPYFANRRYGEHRAEIGLGSLEQYLRDLDRVMLCILPKLAERAVLWWVVGDSQSGSGGAGGDYNAGGRFEGKLKYRQGHTGLDDRQAILVPSRVALSFQQHGWLIRREITWDQGSYRPASLKHLQATGISSEKVLMVVRDFPHKWNWEYATTLVERETVPPPPGSKAQPKVRVRRDDRGDVWHLPRSKNKTGHPAPFSVEIAERCILLSTDPGDVVLDPFNGSGTTVLAAERNGRKAIGMDLYEWPQVEEGET